MRVKNYMNFLCLALCLSVSSSLWGQCIGTPGLDLYWRGTNGSGDYNNPANWRVGSLASTQEPCQSPRSSDNVFFTAAAFPVPGATVHIDQNSNCRNMIWDNTIATKPRVTGANTRELDIYGRLTLTTPNDLDFDYRGAIIFKGTGSTVYTVDTKGHILKLADFRINIDDAAELRLVSPLNLRNYSASYFANDSYLGGVIYHITGHFNSNGQPVEALGFHSNNGNTGRRISFDGSYIRLQQRTTSALSYMFNVSNLAAAQFSAAGSHIHLRMDDNATTGLYSIYTISSALALDSISFETSTGPNYQRIRFGGKIMSNYLRFVSGAEITGINFETEVLECEAGVTLSFPAGAEAAMNQFIGPSTCGETATWQCESPTGKAMLRRKTPGALTVQNILFQNFDGNTASGSSYMANLSFDGGGNSNIGFGPLGACAGDMYFRNTVSENWHDVENWYDAGGTQLMRLPSAANNVFFNNLSGNTRVLVNRSTAYCADMTWLPTTQAGMRLRLDRMSLHVLGDVVLHSNMEVEGNSSGYEVASGIRLYGSGKSYSSAGARTMNYLTISAAGDYAFMDSFYGTQLFMRAGAMIRSNNIGMSLSRFIMSSRIMNDTRVWMRGGGWPLVGQTASPIINYTGTSTFYITDAPPNNAQTIEATYPNLEINSRADVRCSGCTVQGNLTLHRTTNLAFRVSGEATRILVQGDVFIASGSELILSGRNTSDYFRVDGDLNAIGSCAQPTTIRTHNGNPIEFRVSGTANINYGFLQGLNSSNPITANNSIDGGGNTNISFTSGASQTYYWRAHSANPTNFQGNWSDPGHWTLNPLSTVGDSGCIPSLADDVFFDNLSRSATSNGCVIDGQASCRNFSATSAVAISSPTINQSWYIAGNFTLDNTVQINAYRGYIYMLGGGNHTIHTAGLSLHSRELVFDNPAGQWSLQSDLVLRNNFSALYSGRMFLNAGTLNANGYDITIDNSFHSELNRPRNLIFNNSRITVRMNGQYHPSNHNRNLPWSIGNSGSINIQAGELYFEECNHFASIVELNFGDNFSYPLVDLIDADQTIRVRGQSSISYARWDASTLGLTNMAFDSLAMYGGKNYTITSGRTYTLNAPEGKLISNGTSSSFINLRSSVIGSPASIYKDHGDGFCVDFLKVQDVLAFRQSNIALVPAPYDLTHTLSLFFDTGENCDDINGSATSDPNSIWRFSLQPLVSPQYAGGTTLQVCALASPPSFTIPVTGTSPYLINYTWQVGATTGTGVVSAVDDDNNPSTPFDVRIPLHTNDPSINYEFEVTTFRCGDETTPINRSVLVQQPQPNVLTQTAQTSTCRFDNAPDWFTLIGSIDSRPILSIRDSVNPADLTALGNVLTEVFFDPTVQLWNDGTTDYPYLQRHWQVRPQTNGPALVRLYFTRAELLALGAAGLYNPNPDPQIDIRVRKFSGNGVGVGTMQIVPHTVIPLTGVAASPFSTTTDVIAIEFEVTSFSHFIITPTIQALLPLNLLAFDAQAVNNSEVHINWTVEQEGDIESYSIERSKDAQSAQYIHRLGAQGLSIAEYSYIDQQPYSGTSYYRIASHKADGRTTYSPWRAVEIEGRESMRLYPNPSAGILQVDLRSKEAQGAQLRIHDALGRLVYSRSLELLAGQSLFSLDLGGLNAGIYFLEIASENGNLQFREQFIRN